MLLEAYNDYKFSGKEVLNLLFNYVTISFPNRSPKLWVRLLSKIFKQKKNSVLLSEECIWIYVNGMATTEHIVEQDLLYLKKIFPQQKIIAFHNQTHGLYDLIETSTDIHSQVVNEFRSFLKHQPYRHIVLIGHSQGTEIISKALHNFKTAAKIDVKMFANISDLDYSEKFKTELFLNTGDSVGYHNAKNLPIYLREASGHFLITHYLKHFDQFKNKNGNKSSLHKHYKKQARISRLLK